jgi:hypothetical protein
MAALLSNSGQWSVVNSHLLSLSVPRVTVLLPPHSFLVIFQGGLEMGPPELGEGLSVSSGVTERLQARTVKQVWPCHPTRQFLGSGSAGRA